MENKDGMSSRRDGRGSSGRRSGASGTVAAEYEAKIRESQTRLTKYTAENDRLLDEVSNLRLQMREMKNDRNELVRAHQESMSLLAQVSEEKLVEFKSKSDQEALESKAAQEEALRTVLEMMEKDCEDRVAELDNELARVDEERERATKMQVEAASKAEEEEANKREFEDAARLAIEKLVMERQSRSAEVQNLEARESQLKHELEVTKQRAEIDKRAAVEAAAAASAAAVQQNNFNADDGGSSFTGSSYSDPDDRTSNTGDSSTMSPLLQDQRSVSSDATSHRPPVIVHRRSMHKHFESPFLDDHTFEMTRGRRIALALQSMGWYQPKRKHWDSKGLGLQSAWCFFEHSVLPRYIVRNHDGSIPFPDDSRLNGGVSVYESETGSSAGGSQSGRDDDSDVDDWLDRPKAKAVSRPDSLSQRPPRFGLRNGDLSRAEPGESRLPTRLYSPLFTPLSQMGDFGIGIGLYFSSLRAIAFITFVAGCINIPNILYFAGEDYSANQPGVSTLLKGSAICTEQVWVPCPTCDVEDFGQARDRIAGAATVTPDGELQTLVFAKKNTCDGATMMVGICNMASLGFILLAIVILSIYQRRKQIEFDEQEQTAQDYSIEISNPPGDATEPEEWKEFFETRFGGHLTCCTVAIDNDLLVKALAERREVLFHIEEQLKEGASLNTLTLSELAAKIEHGRTFLGKFKSRMSPGIPELVGRLTVLNTRIQGLVQQEYRATRVFCTFETEGAQRHVLQKMSVGSFAAYRNDTHQVNPNLLFRGEHVLLLREAEEPSTIRWMDLDEKWMAKLKQISITTAISLGSVVIVALIVALLRRKSVAYAAVGISISNMLFPAIAKILTNMEAHPSETGKQSSLFVKIAIFRWVVTAIVITIITPFTSTLTNGPAHLIESIYVIFFADLVTANVFQLLDPVGNFKRHFLAPRASSQERMNLLMGGTEYTVAERYTNTTKTLFLTFYYCAIYPSAFFICAFTLIVNFYVDKFSLMRTWKPAPALGPYIAKFSRVYFMSSAIAAMALISSYLYSGFPFDNLCGQDVSHSAYYGTWKITNGEGVDGTAIIEPGVRSFHFCNQFLGPGSNFAFPALPIAQKEGSVWMTNEQQDLINIYGWLSVGVIGLVGLGFLFEAFNAARSIFGGSYKVDGGVHGKTFSQVETISSYIPQIKTNQFTHPLLAANIDEVDESIFDWQDPERSYSFYDLTRDAEQLLKGNEDVCNRAFGQIRHWPPGGPAEGDMGNGGTKSALRRTKDINTKRNVSWSSKVTCKTYSKDDPNAFAYNLNSNGSTSEGMNFSGHSDPLFDPHAQSEGRSFKGAPPQSGVPNFDPYANQPPQDFQNDGGGYGPPPPQAPPAQQHFDQYHNTGLDYDNQLPDQMYGDSQQAPVSTQGPHPTDEASWEGSEGTGSRSGSGTGSYSQSDSTGSGGSYSSESGGSFSQERSDDGSADEEYYEEEGSFSTGSGSSSSGGLPPVS